MESPKGFGAYGPLVVESSFRMAPFYRCWQWRPLGWGIYAALLAVTVSLGIWGFRTVEPPNSPTVSQPQGALADLPSLDAPEPLDWSTAIYQVILLFALNSGIASNNVNRPLECARWFAALFSSATIATVLLRLFSDRVLRAFVYVAAQRHIVVAGLGRYGHLLVIQLIKLGKDVIVIDPRPTDANLDACRAAGAIVLAGDPASPEMLRRAKIEKATRLLVLFGADEETMRVMTAAFEVHRDESAKQKANTEILQCVAKIDARALLPLVVPHEMNVSSQDRFALTSLAPNDIAASTMLDMARGERYAVTLQRVLISGPGELAESLIFMLIRDARETGANRPEIHVCGGTAKSFVDGLKRRYSQLDSGARFETHDHSYADPGGDFDAAFVCVEESSQAASEAVHLAERLTGAPVIAAVANSESGLGALLKHRPTHGPGANLHVVSLQDITLDPLIALFPNNETLARATHENYLRSVRRQLGTKRAAGDGEGERKLLDKPANRAWIYLDGEYSDDNREQVLSWRKLLRTPTPQKPNIYRIVRKGAEVASKDFEVVTSLSAPEVEYLAPIEHDRWMASKIAKGWRYGEQRSDIARTNPAIRPYAELSDDDKEYDLAVFRNLPQFLERAGYVIVREKSAKSAPFDPT